MPISKYFKGHGDTVMANMKGQYGEKEGEHIFYATANKDKQKPKGKAKKNPSLEGIKHAIKR